MEHPEHSTRHGHRHHGRRRHRGPEHVSRSHRHHRGESTRSRPTLMAQHEENKENLVNVWLEEIEARKGGAIDGKTRPSNHGRADGLRSVGQLHDSWTPHGLPFSKTSGDPETTSRVRKRHKRKRGQNQATDSSIIEPVDHRRSTPVIADAIRFRRPPSESEESYYERGKKRQRSDSEESHSSSPPPVNRHQFDKRSRHKTREDRYDTVKHEKAPGKKKNTKKTPQKETGDKGKMKKGQMTSTKEVMDNFASRSILNERISVRTLPKILHTFRDLA